jgi:hypothetical protein
MATASMRTRVLRGASSFSTALKGGGAYLPGFVFGADLHPRLRGTLQHRSIVQLQLWSSMQMGWKQYTLRSGRLPSRARLGSQWWLGRLHPGAAHAAAARGAPNKKDLKSGMLGPKSWGYRNSTPG